MDNIGKLNAVVQDILIAGMEHRYVGDQLTREGGFHRAQCACGHLTLGYSTPEVAQRSLERHHINFKEGR